MENFTYCYLSPFIVGLLVFIAIIVGIVGACFVVAWLHEKAKYDWLYGKSLPKAAQQVVDTTGKIAGAILWIIVAIAMAVILGFSAWQCGLAILKRVMCM